MPHIAPYSLVPWLVANWRHFVSQLTLYVLLFPLPSACCLRRSRTLAAQPGRSSCGLRDERQRIGRDVLGDDAARADIGALADLDRRHQRGVGADEGAGADLGAMLGEAVIVAGDGAGADIGARRRRWHRRYK